MPEATCAIALGSVFPVEDKADRGWQQAPALAEAPVYLEDGIGVLALEVAGLDHACYLGS